MRMKSTRKALVYLAAIFVIGLGIGGVGGFVIGFAWKFKVPTGTELEEKIFQDLIPAIMPIARLNNIVLLAEIIFEVKAKILVIFHK